MPDNDKREMLLFWGVRGGGGDKLGKLTGNTNKVGNNISMQNKLDMTFQPS